MFNLKIARLFNGKSQNDIEKFTGVFQSKISRYEAGIQCLTQKDKKKIESFLQFPINWDSQEHQAIGQLSENERNVIRLAFNILKANLTTNEFFEWVSSYKSIRDLYKGSKDLIDNKITINI